MKRSKFNLGHYKLLTCKMGQLVPVTWFETLPGDTIEQASSALVRCAPLVTPVMHPIQVRFHHFFVPNRILWTSWQDFITGGSDGLNASAHPYLNNVTFAAGSLGDYLGLPTAGSGVTVNALPFRAYQMIWNEYFRDEDLQTLAALSTADGSDSTTSTSLQNCSWEKDYYTSSRPWAFKGSSITLPLGTTAPVRGIGVTTAASTAGPTSGVFDSESSGGSQTYTHSSALNQAGWFANMQASGSAGTGNLPLIFADLSAATAIDINTVRHAFALQRFEEARARYGSRYTEYLRYLGVRSSDARLQRPEFLGSSKQIIQFSEVLQTAPTTSGTAGGAGGVGQFGGHGITAVRGNFYRRFFEEHGIVMTLMSVRPKTMYSQPVDRRWLRSVAGAGHYQGFTGNKEDYWQKELQHIGQQAVNNLEIDNAHGSDGIFGYQDRYDEYRRMESQVASGFRATLDTWHLSREFSGTASLNSAFVSCVPSTRIFADTSSDNLYVMARHQIRARRLVSREGTSSIY